MEQEIEAAEEQDDDGNELLAGVAAAKGWDAAGFCPRPMLNVQLENRMMIIVEYGTDNQLSLQLGEITKYHSVSVGPRNFNYEIKLMNQPGRQDINLQLSRYSAALDQVGQWCCVYKLY